MLTPDTVAPDFELQDAYGNTVKLADYRGSWVVLWWYPKASSGSCTAEGQAFKEWGETFQEAGAHIVGLSFDSHEDNCTFAEGEGFQFPLLSDPSHAVGQEYDVERPEGADFSQFPFRYTYLVDPEGIIRRAYDVGMDVASSRAHPQEVFEDLRELQSQR